jgi:predicted ABC-type transport system involved in lysophospholipase L1 biosynthesis ATPase subunit
MIVGTATTPADGVVPGIAPSAPPRVGTSNTAGTGSAREAKRWLVAQGRPGRRFFLAAGLADVGRHRRRVALARAFLSDAGLVLVDEPTAHLDAATEAALIEPLARLLRGRTALVASHSDVVLGIADRIVDLDSGRIRG